MSRLTILTAVLLVVAAPAFAAQAPAAGIPAPVSCVVTTSDGIAIACDQYRNGCPSVIIIVPGFYNSKENRWMRKTVEMVASDYDVIICDLRGHGRSGGRFTWSAREDRDVRAVIDYARSQGYARVSILAYSLGAAATVNAVADRDDVDSLVLISCPSRFDMIDFRFWEPGMLSDLADNIGCGWQGKGARTGNFFLGKQRPVDSIRRIRRAPVLIIHGDRDWVIASRHARRLYDAAPGTKRLAVIAGGLHAERLVQCRYEMMKGLVLGWFNETLGSR